MRPHYFSVLAATLALSMASCVDNDYDLSDVDTTVRVPVNDLTLPVNIDPIELSSIIDIKEDGRIKVVNGEYAIVEEGDFNSNEINIDKVYLSSSAASHSETTLPLIPGGIQIPGWINFEFSCDLVSDPMAYEINAGNINHSILAIDYLKGDFNISLSMSFPTLHNIVKKIYLNDVVISVPAGLTATPSNGTYDSTAGTITIPRMEVNGASMDINLSGSGLDLAKSGIIFNPVTHTARLAGECRIVSGKVLLRSADISGSLPSSTTLKTSYKMSDITVDSFTGTIQYDVDGANFSDVNLNDLPDVLAQEGTDIRIVNPQIYLNITNPLASYSLGAQTGINITSLFADGTVTDHSIDAPGYFRLSSAPTSSYLLAPAQPATLYPGYTNPQFVSFTSLGSVVSGNGLPQTIRISLVDPSIYAQHVNDLLLGQNLGSVKGTYSFFAPLQLAAGSKIIYTDTENGWNDEDVDAITITTLKVHATITSDLPFSLDFTGYPIDINGNQINNVDIEGARISANANSQDVEITITGTITHLDGIRFEATAIANDDAAKALSPSMTIRCENIRATVGGYYEKEL